MDDESDSVNMAMQPFPFAAIGSRPQALRVTEDYGSVGHTATAPHYVRAENGEEYLMKGTSFSPGHPYCAANELVVTRLAETLGLPVLNHAILEMRGELFFGSRWMERPTFYPQIDEQLFQKCGNKDRVYDLAAFDVWVCNRDRHHENLLVRRKSRPDGTEENWLLLNDHSHCPLAGGEHPSQFPNLTNVSIRHFFRLDFIRDAIVDSTFLSASVDAIEQMSDHAVRAIVDAAPSQWLSSQDRLDYQGFLLNRRNNLRTILRNETAVFANLQGGIP